jgi:hypothetical protein
MQVGRKALRILVLGVGLQMAARERPKGFN